MAMFENFPYTDMHNLNLDWIIKIAKDFLDQYTHIQELIANGETSLQNLTESGLEQLGEETTSGLTQLQNKATEIETLLNEWYSSHSSDIANELASALADIQSELLSTISTFSIRANQIAQDAAQTIPQDYSELSNTVELLKRIVNSNNILNNTGNHLYYGCYFNNGGFTGNSDYNVFQFPVKQGQTYIIQCRTRFIGTNTTNIATSQSAGYEYTADQDRDLYITVYVEDSPNWIVTKSGVLLEDALPYGAYGLNPEIIKQETGNGKNDVMSQRAISTELSNVTKLVNDKNILNYDEVTMVPDKYYYQGGYTGNDEYCVFIIPVIAGKTYIFAPPVRFLTKNVETIATATNPNYSYTADATENIYASIRREYANDWIVVISPDSPAEALPYGVYGLSNDVIHQLFKNYPQHMEYHGNAQYYTLGHANSIKRNKIFKLAFDFTTFGRITIQLQYEGGSAENSFSLDNTYFKRTVEGQERPSVAHNLTLSDRLYITIETGINGIKYTAECGTEQFTQSFNYVSGSVKPYYESVNMTITNVDFSWTCKDFNNDIWLFGDSYISNAPERWLYYLLENGYDKNCLIDAYPGEDSPHALASLKSYIDIVHPKMIVWTLGMNDGNEVSAISTQWKTAIDELIQICDLNNIELVLATIPTVPTINHEYKNAWIRESGYQYIDFAKAVGAQSDGTWFTGMLSNDGIHPTIKGGITLYRQAITDCPQFMISK